MADLGRRPGKNPAIKFSSLRDGDTDDIPPPTSSSPPKKPPPPPAMAAYDDFLAGLQPPPGSRVPRPPSAFAKPATTATAMTSTTTTAAATSAATPSTLASSVHPPPPPAPPPPPPPPPQTQQQQRRQQQPKVSPFVSATAADEEEDSTVEMSDSAAAAAAAVTEPWPFGEDVADSVVSPSPRVLRTDAPPPNPLAAKFPLLFTLLTAALAVLCSAPLPLPDLAKGLIIGCSMACCLLVYFYLEFLANSPVVIHYAGVKYCKNPRANVLASGVSTRRQQQQRQQQSLDGFLNEAWSYDVDRHHLNYTFTVYACLDGRQLTLRRPQNPQVPKRVLYSDEPPSLDSMTYSDTRQFDLLNARIRLQPEGLVRKRLWSKKYPIHVCLVAAAGDTAKAAARAHYPAPSSSAFEEVRVGDCVQRDLYLFARTSREKELWYRRMYAACNGLPQPEALYRLAIDSSPTMSMGEQARRFAEYAAAFGRFADISDVQMGSADKPELNFLNALLLRATWDIFRTPYWADLIKAKMDARLKKIRLPYFIEELSVAEVNMGSAVPVLRRLHKPHVNDRGIWFHLDIDYPGGCSASLVTRINLHRLQDRGSGVGAAGGGGGGGVRSTGSSTPDEASSASASRGVIPSASADSISAMSAASSSVGISEGSPVHRLAAVNAELEDSGESTTDESGQSEPEPEAEDPALGNVGGKHSRKVIKFIDKVAQSERFHSLLGKYKFLRKAVDSVSNTKILLSVDVHSLRGTLVLNLPFPPSDRVWAAFHPVPHLVLTSRPKIGEKEFSARKISDLISKKLIAEFHRVFVLPNMEDFYLPTLNSDEALLASGYSL